MNQFTHWLDASNVYGSNDQDSEKLRLGSGGKLKFSTQNGQDMLPLCSEFSELNDKYTGIEACNQPCGEDCFAAGLYSKTSG